MKDFAIILGVLACIIQLYSYWLYNRSIYDGSIKPNATSWGLWALGSGVAYWSYSKLENGWIEDMLPLVCALVCAGTFIVAVFKGKFSKPKREDLFIAIIDIQVIAFWLLTDSEVWTNVLMQIDVIISFLPILRDTWKSPSDEKIKPWAVWCVAYTLMLMSVLLLVFSGKSLWVIMYPINYFLLHITVALMIKFRTAKA